MTDEISCRYCYESTGELLRMPCTCKGSMGYMHADCLRLWKNPRGCYVCNLEFPVTWLNQHIIQQPILVNVQRKPLYHQVLMPMALTLTYRTAFYALFGLMTLENFMRGLFNCMLIAGTWILLAETWDQTKYILHYYVFSSMRL
jgi:hypothetical protein